MNTTLAPGSGEVEIKLGPVDHDSDLLIVAPDHCGQVYVSLCEVGNVHVMQGVADLATFPKTRRIPRGLPVTLRIRSNWHQPVTIGTTLLRRAS
jgi:hypothetical protein